jgi:hypothetical protein
MGTRKKKGITMSFSGPYMFQYAANPQNYLGASDQQSGAKLSLLPTNSSPSQTLWMVNYATGQIALAASNNQLVLDISNGSFSNETPLILNAISYTSNTQSWSTFQKPGFILSNANPNYCIDDQARLQKSGTTVWLYQFNGSPAQQWNIIPLSQFLAQKIR